MGKINSKKKGASGERELANKLKEFGYNTRRGQQYNGLEGEDVVGLDYIHIECKRVERLDLGAAMYQATKDAKENQLPAVFHRKNHSKWLVTMELDNWMQLYNEFYSGRKLEEREKTTTRKSISVADIDTAIKELKKIPNNINNKLYLNPSQIEFKQYLESEGFDVIVTNNLPDNTSIIYGNFEDKEE